MTVSTTAETEPHHDGNADRGGWRSAPSFSDFVDPLEADGPTDEVVVTTRRGICRVALVAAEASSRFQREGVGHDAMTWMLAPRRLFQGASALDACLALDACMRAILLHGLSLGVDAEPRDVDELIGDDDGVGSDDDDGIDWSEEPTDGDLDGVVPPPSDRRRADRLFTATFASYDGFETVHAFHASLARDEAEVAGRLFMRFGPAAADAVIVDGFDAGAPMAAALVAPAMGHMLSLVAADPTSPLANGLDVNVEQRFVD